MDASRELITAWSYGLAGGVYGVFALYLAAGWQAGRRRRYLCVAMLLSALWGIAGMAYALTGLSVFLAGNLLGDLLRFGAWYFFLIILLGPESPDDREMARRLRLFRTTAVALLAVGLLAQFLIPLAPSLPFSPHRLVLLISLGTTVFALLLVEQLFRNAVPDSRWNIKPLCIGLGGAVLFDLYLYSDALLFNRIDADAFAIRGFVHALVVPLVVLSTLRSHDWKNRVVLSQRAALQSASLVAVGIYLLFVAAAGYYVRYFGGEWGRAFQLALLFASLLLLGILALSASVRARLRVFIGKHFFRYRYDYRDEWLRFTSVLSSQDEFSTMGEHVIKGLAEMVESPAGALWLKDPSGRFHAQAAAWNMPPAMDTEEVTSSLTTFLSERNWVIDLEEYRAQPGRYAGLHLPEWLSRIPNAWLLVPLASGDGMIGFVILATARTQLDINWEVIDLLKTAGRQAGAFLGQMQATEALLEARKFDAFNRMSAFVVHDLKNIVAQLSLMLKNAERHRDNPEFQKDMLMTVEHSVDRMRQLMMQLREGATPIEGPRGVDLGDAIRRIQSARAGQGRVVETRLCDGKVVAKGHEDRVERVIGHVVQNALDATEHGGRVWVSLQRQPEFAVVEVGDTGHGMSPEFIRERLFKPFQTTKASGMGIGAYESFQYIQEIGGKVTVESEVDAGTRVTLWLPYVDKGTEMNSDARSEGERQ
ncbi:XrtA/PEP-CTERM system histidine kinase PrsK [Propionivibrio limicola]|uniref:XrtA/PEP-CTERM system histidine kinase PrsK n=1 Tax=Propionivibrio limicola TaxID=167645 RepID=UPI001290A195|nr:XrtA/PEP-CTERM system histidine kinase PrsK [Propionivibrio limicola]